MGNSKVKSEMRAEDIAQILMVERDRIAKYAGKDEFDFEEITIDDCIDYYESKRGQMIQLLEY